MAKYECSLVGDFDQFLKTINRKILEGSISAKFENGSNFSSGSISCAVRVYERYSAFGGNRVSLSLTVIGNKADGKMFVSAITSGGSKAVFMKINTVGEESFLRCLIDVVEAYKKTNRSV